MNVSDLRTKSSVELRAELEALLKEQFSLRMQNATQQLQRNHLLRDVRKNIARIKTLLTEKMGKNNE
jgi:large subunit ribosomal protein L29